MPFMNFFVVFLFSLSVLSLYFLASFSLEYVLLTLEWTSFHKIASSLLERSLDIYLKASVAAVAHTLAQIWPSHFV